ncbi:MAG: thiamine pyrophosphate-binding protein [Devosia sp.]|uniref:thiamine pyrophosphate-binding protein n=1 Tax=Devosia sp. TaxID=1871048 RepID=UPI002605F424|nr:thiamine pyrophosphate-binding protein [Devosia sp.]MDB5540107.1 thiamine pyrophosphate-binding protein [Devosia sp.]
MTASTLPLRTGGHLLVDQLLVQKVDTVFCVPGESYLEVLDGLYDARDRIRLINARHEAGAANMAEAYGKLTGRPGICMVTRGPGACHAAVGVHTAFQDSTPMILLIGQVGREFADREAFQEIDYRAMFAPVAKWVAQIEVTARIPEYLARAFTVATQGRPGPVVLALPEDMLREAAQVPDAPRSRPIRGGVPAVELDELRDRLVAAERPMVLVGGSGWSDAACRHIQSFCESNGLPVACSFRRQDIFDNNSASFAGDLGTSGPPALVKRMKQADLLVVVGARLGEMTTQGYTIMDPPVAGRSLVHIHADSGELGRVYAPDLAINTGVNAFAEAVADARWISADRYKAWRENARADYLAYMEPNTPPGPVDLPEVMRQLQPFLQGDYVLTLDAGNHTGWPQRFLSYARPGRQIGPTSGAMGYSVPAAVAASLVRPDALVIGCVGDGGFMMSGQEIATAVQHGGRPIVLVFNNGMYGTIRMHQERHHPGRVIGTDLTSPDFVAYGKALGAHSERVTSTEEFLPAFERARASGKAAVIDIEADPELVSTRFTLSSLGVVAN